MTLSRHAWMVSVALAACAAPVMHWEKPGASEAKVKEEERAVHDTETFQRCMRDKGYSAKR